MIHAIVLLMFVFIMFTFRVTVSNGELLSSYCIKWRVTYRVIVSNGELPIELLYQMASYLSSYCVKWLNVGKVI